MMGAELRPTMQSRTAPSYLAPQSFQPTKSITPGPNSAAASEVYQTPSRTTMELASPSLLDFVQRYNAYLSERDNTLGFIRDLLQYTQALETDLRQENTQLSEKLRDQALDLDDSHKARRDLQLQLRDAQNVQSLLVQENDNLKNRNPYVIFLIDGDGLIFTPEYVAQGVDGGKQASYALRTAIQHQLQNQADEVEIICKVFANLGGLTKAMRRDGSLGNDQDLKNFTLGFTQALASFDFIDVGHGKERADSKIKESTRWNLRNFNCKQILLGISHDAGYAPFLDEICRDQTTRRRLTVVEGFPTHGEIRSTGVNVLGMAGIFRKDKLADKTPVITAASAPLPTTGPPATGPPATAPPSTQTSTPASHHSSSYAGVAQGASPPPKITLPLQIKSANARQKATTQPQAQWNPGPRGLDEPIPIVQSVLDNVKKRKDSNKLCNNHFLRGPCAKGDDCCFEHNYKPSQDEINAIAYLARLNPCVNGQECDVADCIYGHHCPTVENGWCTRSNCKFREDEHPPGCKYKQTKNNYYY